ncbi:hypothetical protein MRB53_026535 [Persea americana]|uniref:Uncharacterized protein n=1 Tax=Persea americana TaxID=3435 RepID=A0ACC2LIF0_PERAE|nr:hypothetical protein MRB53_026535 [Persea americana]
MAIWTEIGAATVNRILCGCLPRVWLNSEGITEPAVIQNPLKQSNPSDLVSAIGTMGSSSVLLTTYDGPGLF